MPTTYAIPNGRTAMDATIWTGTGANPQTITNSGGFKPDLIWLKGRSNTAYNQLSDSVRGFTKSIYSNTTDAEETNAINGYTTTANSNGFAVTAGSNSGFAVNASGTTYVGWQWVAGQGVNNTNVAGSITSTVSVNTTTGFSIVTYTGTGANATVGHGLSTAPQMIIAKCRSSTLTNWAVYHASINATPQNYTLILNTTAAKELNSIYWNNTAPTSSVFSLGGSDAANKSGQTQVAYCWAPVAGFSQFGSYTGNGSADGPFIYTGFRPQFMLVKRTDTAGYGWHLLDAARNPFNIAGKVLIPNSAAAESDDAASYGTDFVSNGFKFRTAAAGVNGSGATYIYMAFAENPFKYANAR